MLDDFDWCPVEWVTVWIDSLVVAEDLELAVRLKWLRVMEIQEGTK